MPQVSMFLHRAIINNNLTYINSNNQGLELKE